MDYYPYYYINFLILILVNFKSYTIIIIAHQTGMLVGILSIYKNLHSKIKESFSDVFSTKLSIIRETYRKYSKYAIFSSPSQILNHAGMWLPVIFIWLFFEQKYAHERY